jgi:hypothetical protein
LKGAEKEARKMLKSPEYLTFAEVQERINCTENDLRRWVLRRMVVASYYFTEDVAKIVERFNREDRDGSTIWVPQLKRKAAQLDDEPNAYPYELEWISGFFYLVYPHQKGPLTGSFYLLSTDRDFSEVLGGECYHYSPRSKPGGLSMDEVVKNGAFMATEVERLVQMLHVGEKQTDPGAGARPTTHAEKLAAAKDAMKKHEDDQIQAAKELGISPKTLRRWLGIDGTKPRGPTKTGWGSQLIRKK